MTEAKWLAYRREFPIFERLTYFNSCSLGALSQRVAAAVGTFTDLWHAHGAAAVDVRDTGVDFLVTRGLKWLLGGPGIAYLYVRRDVAGRLQPADVGWFAHRRQFDFDITRFDYLERRGIA